eukprot:Amastigsp_a343857_7.p4 type:complete len:106 gc:universal Amastigsp_a343857_7:208-525(+)
MRLDFCPGRRGARGRRCVGASPFASFSAARHHSKVTHGSAVGECYPRAASVPGSAGALRRVAAAAGCRLVAHGPEPATLFRDEQRLLRARDAATNRAASDLDHGP